MNAVTITKYRIVDDIGTIYECNEEDVLKETLELIICGEIKLKTVGELRLEKYELPN